MVVKYCKKTKRESMREFKSSAYSIVSLKLRSHEAKKLDKKLEELIRMGKAKSKKAAFELIMKEILSAKIKKAKEKEEEFSTYVFRCDYDLHKDTMNKCINNGITLTEGVRRVLE